jgi:hypothetical protein
VGQKFFTRAEDGVLKARYCAYVRVEDVAAELGRSPGVIQQRVLVLGLRRDHNLTRALHDWAPHLLAKVGKVSEKALLKECRDYHRDMLDRELAAAERLADENAARLKQETERIINNDVLSRHEKLQQLRALGLTLRKLGNIFDLSTERVRQLLLPAYGERLQRRKAKAEMRLMNRLLRLWEKMPREVRAAFLQREGCCEKPKNHRR